MKIVFKLVKNLRGMSESEANDIIEKIGLTEPIAAHIHALINEPPNTPTNVTIANLSKVAGLINNMADNDKIAEKLIYFGEAANGVNTLSNVGSLKDTVGSIKTLAALGALVGDETAKTVHAIASGLEVGLSKDFSGFLKEAAKIAPLLNMDGDILKQAGNISISFNKPLI